MAMKRALLGAVLACGVAHANGERQDLAYLAVADGYWEVWVANADGTGARQLTKSKHDKTRVSWFPEGAALLVSSNEGRAFKVDLQGNETAIALEQYPVVDAVVSPDGKRIAYSFSSAIDGNDIWLANSDGTAAEKLVKMPSLQHEPVWSPDGEYIYFLSGDGGQAHDIWRVSLQTRRTEQLTIASLYHFDIAVSPSGEVAYSSNRSGNYEIWLERNGGKPEALTSDPALDARPVFSPDGRLIVFESTRSGTPNLWRLDRQSRALEQITQHQKGARAPAWYQGAAR